MALSKAAWVIAGWAGSAVVDKLISTAFTYFGDHVLPDDSTAELKRLQEALPKITAVMGIAEALKMKHLDASQWVEKFRLAVEASEDVLDRLDYKRLEDMVKGRDGAGGSASSSKKRKSCSIDDDTLERLKEAVTMLDQAANGVDHLLKVATLYGIYDPSESRQEAGNVLSRETTSFLVERKLFGRKVEMQKIIDWLKQPTDARLSSFGIVGVGGLGKTTLVQFAYQEMRGSNHFDETIWVCVSIKFSVEDITRKILGELGKNNCNNKPLNALQETLKENIHSKKILLVLDDIWEDKESNDWDQMFAPLRFVKKGSKIIFTTRMKSVADLLERVISTEHESLSLEDLPEQYLRSMFQSYAFDGYNGDNRRDLEGIGDQILKMLRGSPLAAKVIGCLLNSHMDKGHWGIVLKHRSIFKLEPENNVVEVLKLSYYHLPANLQVCFRFCSIFPQDHMFDKNDLIKMWICSGFIRQQSSFPEKKPEDIGEDYFNLLLRKSFFETRKGEKRYVMHDLMHELAQKVSDGECCRIEPNDTSTIPSTVRHVYVHADKVEKVSHLENLRSLVVTSDWDSFVLPNYLIKNSLRLLKICGWGTSEMPKEISYLMHLRYLSLMGPKNNFDFLASVDKLYHLQLFEISGKSLKSLPATMVRLSVLESLQIMNAKLLEELPELPASLRELKIWGASSLKSLPATMVRLTALENLKIEEAKLLEELPELPASLRDLYISGASSLKSLTGTMARLTILESLQITNAKFLEKLPELPASLRELKIWGAISLKSLPATMVRLTVLQNLIIEEVHLLEELPELPASLRDLDIRGSRFLKSLPATMVTLTVLESLQIMNFQLLENLPELPTSLRKLKIISASSLKSLPATMVRLTALENLKIWRADLLENLPELPASLRKLKIIYASALKSLPATMVRLTALENLKIEEAKLLEELPELPASLRSLYISRASSLKSLPRTMARLTVLENLTIEKTNLLEELPELPASLSELYISGTSSLKSLPGTMARLTVLENLTIEKADFLEELPELPASLSELKISDASSLNSLPATMVRLTALENLQIWRAGLVEEVPELPASLGDLDIRGARSLKSLPATMARLTILESLRIEEAKLLEELPELPASLRSLYISGASSLKSLPATMVRLTALENLKIEEAKLLEELPELPASLRKLKIIYASALKSLPATMVRLTALENLKIEEAKLLEELPELPASLRSLYISGASSLKSLPATMVRLTALENLKIEEAKLLEELPCWFFFSQDKQRTETKRIFSKIKQTLISSY